MLVSRRQQIERMYYMMKKVISLTAALLVCFGMTACGDKQDTGSSQETSAVSAAETTAAEESAASAETPAESSAEQDEDLFGIVTVAPAGVNEYRIIGGGYIGDVFTLDLILDDDYTLVYSLEMDKEFGDVLLKFSSNYMLKTDASSGILGEYELISNDTGESLGQMTAEEITAAFDPTVGKEIVDWDYKGEVKLSEFEEGKLYKADAKEDMPKFVNDTDTDYIVHIMSGEDYYESSYTYPVKEIEGIGREEPYVLSVGDSFYVSIEKLTADMLDPDDLDMPALFINGLEKGESIEIGLNDMMVNAGDTDVDIKIFRSEGDPIELKVGAGEIYAVNWMNIDHIEIV